MTQLIDIVVPQGEDQGTTHVLSNWLKHPGDTVEANAPIVDIETDKVMLEVAAPASGRLKTVFANVGEEIQPGAILGQIEIGGLNPLPNQTTPLHSRNLRQADGVLLSPAVRKLVKQHQLDISLIQGSGKHGRVTKQDVLAYLENRALQPVIPATPEPIQVSTTSMETTHIPHTGMRKKIAQHMVESLLHTAPHVTSVFEADLSAITRHRQQHQAALKQRGIPLTYTAYFVYAAVKALELVPEANSQFHEEYLELFPDINIGIGTALEDKGLVVPVVQQAQGKSLSGIATELHRLTEKARNGDLQPSDMKGGTFTISNHGVSGSLVATPIIINQPQSAILGIGKMEKRVVVREVDGQDTIQIKPMAYVTLTIDHRALDGYLTNKFLSRFVEVIEQWES